MKPFSATSRLFQVATVLGATLSFLAPIQAGATVIGFEDLTTRNNFTALGIVDSYQGYEWGYGSAGGVGARTFVNTDTGWAHILTHNPFCMFSKPFATALKA